MKPLEETSTPVSVDGPLAIRWRQASAGDAEAWDAFVASRPDANLGHFWRWKDVFERAYRKRCLYLVAEQDETWVGVLPLVYMRGPLAGRRLVSLPFLDRAGILASSAQGGETLLGAALELARGLGSRGLECRGLAAEAASDAERHTLVLKLPRTEKALWDSFDPKVRNQVRKAEREGLRTVSAPADRLGEFYAVFTRNMRDLGSPVHSHAFLHCVLEAFGAAARLYLTVSSTGEAVGGAIALRQRHRVTVPWASSLRAYFPSCPNHSLYWKVLQDSVEQGAEDFDFGRSHRDSGTYRFKKQWGADAIPLQWRAFTADGREEPPRHLKPSEHGGITKLWSRLPVWLANRIGPLIRRQISN
jgi:FemAB-related protein (PEP-CTERM system-associated)